MLLKISNLPSIHVPRSRFDLSHSYKTMFNQADLIPFLVQEIYPGDSFNVSSSIVIRTSVPFVRPIMDNLFLDTYYFFVPNRLVYKRWNEVMGENVNSAWAPSSTPSVPKIKITSANPVQSGSIADYFGLPVGSPGGGLLYVNSLPIRGYGLVVNEWFRNENISDPVLVPTGDNPVVSLVEQFPTFNNNDFSASNIYGKPFKVNKYKDYFTACLKAPQKGDAVSIAFGQGNVAPIKTLATNWDASKLNIGTSTMLKWFDSNGSIVTGFDPEQRMIGIGDAAGSNGTWSIDTSNISTFNIDEAIYPANLGADLNGLEIANVNDLRYAFALQRMLEKDARGGTRYVELLYNHFGVISPDSRLQRPEFLGGRRIPLNVSQIAQTSGTSSTNYQGQVSALSLTNGISGFKKGFVEHGFVIGLCCVRQKHTYQQMLEKFWSRTSRYDYYDPSFAFIGEQPVYYKEIMGTTSSPDDVFGYNEAYADLRFKPGKITGALKSVLNNGLDIWHLGDSFTNTPQLNDTFIHEGSENLDRCLAAPSSTIPNFVMDVYHKISAVRVLPTYGIPGLVDHS